MTRIAPPGTVASDRLQWRLVGLADSELASNRQHKEHT